MIFYVSICTCTKRRRNCLLLFSTLKYAWRRSYSSGTKFHLLRCDLLVTGLTHRDGIGETVGEREGWVEGGGGRCNKTSRSRGGEGIGSELYVFTSWLIPEESLIVSLVVGLCKCALKYMFPLMIFSAPSHRPGDSATPALKFPWHLIPFLVFLFLIIVVLFTYYLRTPDIIGTIILALKERRKHMKASKQNKRFNLTKRNLSIAGFESSTFHSYQRELFYDATLNYGMFEQSKTKAIEFSVHFDEEQFSGREESVEISCVMGEEPANKKQGHDSLDEMFDTGGSDVVTSSAEKTINLHDSPVCYDIWPVAVAINMICTVNQVQWRNESYIKAWRGWRRGTGIHFTKHLRWVGWKRGRGDTSFENRV